MFRALSTLTGKGKGKGSGGAAGAAGGGKAPPGKPSPSQSSPPKRGATSGAKQSAAAAGGSSFGGVRLNKLLAHTGAAPSRRAAEAMIGAGRVSVDGAVIRDVGHKILPGGAAICLDGRPVAAAAAATAAVGSGKGKEAAWVKVHKPKGTLATLTDAQGRKCLAELVPDAGLKGLRPVGRLGRESAGLLLLTDDWNGAHMLAGRAAGLVRVYKVVVEKGMPGPQALSVLAKGIVLEGESVEEEGDEEEGGRGRRGKGGRGARQGGRREERAGSEKGEALPPITVQCVDFFQDRKEAVLEVRCVRACVPTCMRACKGLETLGCGGGTT